MNWMRKSWMKTACMAVVLLTAGSALAQSGRTLDLYLKDADLRSALDMLTRQTGIQFVLADQSGQYNSITLSLREASPEKAIELICLSANAYAERDASGVFIVRFGPKPVISAPPVVAPAPVVKPIIIDKVKVRHTDALEILQQLRGDFNYDPNQAASLNGTFRSGAAAYRSPGVVVKPIEAGQSASEAVRNASPDAGFNWLTGEASLQAGGGGAGLGGGGFGGGQGGGGQGQGGGQGNQGGTQLQAGQGLIPTGITTIQYDPTDGSLVVQGDEEAIRRLRQIIELFDVPAKQVEIKVEFITTSQSASKSFGFDWQYARGAIFTGVRPGEFARTSDPVFINYSTGNLATRLRAQMLSGDGKVVTAPIVRTLNNQTASVFSQIQTTVFIPQTTLSNGTVLTTYNPVQLPINTGLSVRPRIQDDGNIAMILNPQVSDLGQVRRGPDGSEFPDQLTQQIQVAVRVRDRDTIVLGGLNRTQYFTNVNRFPVLSDLPIVGQFFRSTRSERNDQELLIFVTPRVIQDDSTDFVP